MRTTGLLFIVLVPVFVLTATTSWAKEAWIQITSPHFIVVTNANENQGRKVADQFERMRAVFHLVFPKLKLDPGSPIIVLAINGEKDFRALEPEAYLSKGSLKLGGLFLRAADKNYVLMRLDAQGDHPYSVVYHEYTHLLMSKSAGWIPLWMNEGLAEFYQNTRIRKKEVLLGEPSAENLLLLRQHRLLPLSTLLTIDTNSPYYHEENKGSIFYAESWALVHYIQTKDFREKTSRLTNYGELLAQNVDAVTAATRTFGDLQQLYSSLEGYVRQNTFGYLKVPAETGVDDSSFKLESLAPLQADAIRADFLAYNKRTADAQALLDQVLQGDPNNVLAHETKGFIAFREGHLDEAKKRYALAVQLDSRSFLAHYYFAAISMNGPIAPAEEAAVERSLRASIKLNPSFAPSYDRLGIFLAMRHRDLDEAHMMALNAAQLEPENLNYRMNSAQILLEMERGKDAVAVMRNAMHLARSPIETAMAEGFLHHAEEYAQAQAEHRNHGQPPTASVDVTTSLTNANIGAKFTAQDEQPPNGLHHFVTGMLKDVHCNNPALDLKVVSGGETVDLHSSNYFKIEYTALNVTLKENINPCADLEGRPAKVEYTDSASQNSFVVIGIEIHQ